MTIQQLKYAITISETGSLNKASEILYVAQPSLTSSVRELENELGIIIFNRSGRGVSLTNDGQEFIQYARQVVQQYDSLLDKYGEKGKYKKKFGVSTQHYSFAVKCFVETIKHFGTDEFEFAIRETKTREVIDDVANGRSEIGILYLSDFNRKAIIKFLKSNDLDFHHLCDCGAYVFLWKGHPLAKHKKITFEDLKDYPCLSFEQGATGSFYLAEEILSTADYPQIIKANDRATMLNLMKGVYGYTLCSGIICEEMNGDDYLAIPFEAGSDIIGSEMEIGYIVKKNMLLSNVGKLYTEELDKYLKKNVKR
ncbi:MAG: LysR family transcriptional regulator [Lachnospiraceae bacterium]|nr:LysR family transcriptional regulator [Lachnospiraceae bacterium]MBO7600953.1 LysR family transcriptional regulator [Lachnospiraceae bacterium]